MLTQHIFRVRGLTANDSKTSMLLDGNAIAMVFVTNGTAGGGQFGGYFVASCAARLTNPSNALAAAGLDGNPCLG